MSEMYHCSVRPFMYIKKPLSDEGLTELRVKSKSHIVYDTARKSFSALGCRLRLRIQDITYRS